MADLKRLDFALVQYVPDTIKGEFVNLGVLVSDSDGATVVRFTRDWRRVRCLDPGADIEMLQALEVELRDLLGKGTPDRERLLTFLNDSFSNALQLSPTKSCLAESATQEAERLVAMYLDTRRPAGRREASPRQIIYAGMRDAFEQAGVWKLMSHHISAAEFTHKGDPLKIDCGYRPNGVLKMFHAVSLATDVDSAKVLAFTFPQVREGMARMRNLGAHLTAIVEDDLPPDDDTTAFALDAFARTEIAVTPLSQLPQLTEAARREMRV